MTRKNTHHQASRRIANRSSTVVLEDLDVVAMTSSARGTVDNPGRNVARKARLNRSINATGWGQLDGMLQYKCREVLKIPAPYTSQNCNKCGRRDKANRLTQSIFKGNYIAEYPRVLAPAIFRCGGVVRIACASFS